MKMRNIHALALKLKKLILFKFWFPINVMLRYNQVFILNKFSYQYPTHITCYTADMDADIKYKVNIRVTD